jgi:ferredoxin
VPTVKADRGRCEGYGNCIELAPNIFNVDDSGLVTVQQEELSTGDTPRTLAAIRSCPVAALLLVDEDGADSDRRASGTTLS